MEEERQSYIVLLVFAVVLKDFNMNITHRMQLGKGNPYVVEKPHPKIIKGKLSSLCSFIIICMFKNKNKNKDEKLTKCERLRFLI